MRGGVAATCLSVISGLPSGGLLYVLTLDDKNNIKRIIAGIHIVFSAAVSDGHLYVRSKSPRAVIRMGVYMYNIYIYINERQVSKR